jgi:integrase
VSAPLAVAAGGGDGRWRWPIDPGSYDTTPAVRAAEAAAIAGLGVDNLRRLARHDPAAGGWPLIGRLLRPLDDAGAALASPPTSHRRRAMLDATAVVLLRCAETGRSYWAWTDQEWAGLLGRNQDGFRRAAPGWADDAVRPYLAAHAFLLGGFTTFCQLGGFSRVTLAWRVFGRDRVDGEIGRLRQVLAGWGYRLGCQDDTLLPMVACQVFLLNRNPHLEELGTGLFDRIRGERLFGGARLNTLHAMQKAVASLGFCDPPAPRAGRGPDRAGGGSQEWARWVDRWYATSTLTPRVRGGVRATLLKAGRWLASEHPEAADPAAWTRQTCAAWVAALDRMSVGDYAQRTAGLAGRIGKPLQPSTKAALLSAVRTFFRDCQEWEWLPRRFDPQRALGTPRSVAALLGPDPRVIADEVWAKLLWAGLNLETADLPEARAGHFYPFELVRALTLTWLFSGQRSDEIARLQVGCIRWQHDGAPIAGDCPQVLARDAVCLLDVPAHKTGTAFTKPVDPILGQAIDAWQAARPSQPPLTDRRTGERADLLFAFRARRVSTAYVNNTVIPMLCRKAGVPAADVRGAITSHRARSTIASQLYNAKEPMTLFELQAWLGHRSPQSTQFYAKISAQTLTRAYTDAGYFSRNIRTIEVLIDRGAVASGAAASGEPWQHYDLGHGYCTYTFFEQCPHRMACARCDFYTPKDSARAQLLEARTNLQKMTAAIPLTEDEQAAVEDGQAAIDRLLGKLADTPTPAGPTPRQMAAPGMGRMLPVIDARHGKNGQSRTKLFHRMILLTVPSTLPEFQCRVRPLVTACWSLRMPMARERSPDRSSASTAASQVSRSRLPVRAVIIWANAVTCRASASMCGQRARMASSWACSPAWRWSGRVSSQRVIWRVLGTAGAGPGAAGACRNGRT